MGAAYLLVVVVECWGMQCRWESREAEMELCSRYSYLSHSRGVRFCLTHFLSEYSSVKNCT